MHWSNRAHPRQFRDLPLRVNAGQSPVVWLHFNEPINVPAEFVEFCLWRLKSFTSCFTKAWEVQDEPHMHSDFPILGAWALNTIKSRVPPPRKKKSVWMIIAVHPYWNLQLFVFWHFKVLKMSNLCFLKLCYTSLFVFSRYTYMILKHHCNQVNEYYGDLGKMFWFNSLNPLLIQKCVSQFHVWRVL